MTKEINVTDRLGTIKDSMDQVIIKYIQRAVNIWLDDDIDNFDKEELFNNLELIFTSIGISKDLIQDYLAFLDELKASAIEREKEKEKEKETKSSFKSKSLSLPQVVPLECPIQMGLSPITVQMVDVPKNIQLDWLASRRTVASQVDFARLERIQQRKKNRENKSSGLSSKRDAKSAIIGTSNNSLSFASGSMSEQRGMGVPSLSSKEIVDKLLSEKKSGKLDIILNDFDISLDGRRILTNASIVISTSQNGRRYGLVGRNGIGKSTFLKYLSNRQLKGVPDSISILSVEQEFVNLNLSVLEAVLQSDWRRKALLEESVTCTDGGRLQSIYDKLQEIDSDTAESRASTILSGLGFSVPDQSRLIEEFSGGWRIRVALASALFFQPDLLLLDEPTNMLDFPTVVWLQNYLLSIKSTVIVVSHDRFFLDSVSTDIIYMHHEQLVPYSGNYSQFKITKEERERNQQKEYDAQALHRQHLQEFVDRWRYNASKAQLAQSRLKILEKLPDLKPVIQDAIITFKFPSCEQLSPPIVTLDEVSFAYDNNGDGSGNNGDGNRNGISSRMILKNVNFNIQLTSRIAIVGPNGAGKTTLLKLIMGELNPSLSSDSKMGNIYRHPRLKIGYFSQHHIEQLDMTKTPLRLLSDLNPGLGDEELRHHLGAFGITGPLALQRIATLSGGQKSRVSFAMIAINRPHVMILDEPTNHLDMDSIDALIKALKDWNGGVICVSHDKNFISLLCQEIWICSSGKVEKYRGDDIHEYAVDLLRENNITNG